MNKDEIRWADNKNSFQSLLEIIIFINFRGFVSYKRCLIFSIFWRETVKQMFKTLDKGEIRMNGMRNEAFSKITLKILYSMNKILVR